MKSIQQTEVSLDPPLKIGILRRRQMAAALCISCTANAMAGAPSQFISSRSDLFGPFRQNVTGPVANSDQNSHPENGQMGQLG